MRGIIGLCLVLAVATANPTAKNKPRYSRIIGGDVTTIDRYPSAVALMGYDCFVNVHYQMCGGAIINSRSVLTAAHCLTDIVPLYYRKMRVGSAFKNSGGVVHDVAKVIIHSEYISRTVVNDIGIVRSKTSFEFNENVARGAVAGINYYLGDNEPIWAIGWGMMNLTTGEGAEQLREVQVYSINWNICAQRYSENGQHLGENMFCMGLLDVGGKNTCFGDSGSPVYHNNAIVGVCSWGPSPCADARFPSVNTLVSAYEDWLRANA
ncbi:trypsin CFT-1-like isoform X1 [Pieris brassicae]|uniref:Peptidase S1 domain-containing protein n=2 Tax=Pieris brassicae TaxID=7116 RepID=A0A9P0XDZ1_PIEBR|nr:trypsin CFT-1-like isoform X1 [Pieris brassicae]CAH4031358.1 unnamed protein product [Pieris brassicae]